MANPLQLPGPNAVQNLRHQSFEEFYRDPTLDPFQGDYARVMERFDPEVNNALSYVLLLGQAVGGGPVPQAYLCCSFRSGQKRLYCIHLLSRYTGSLDGQAYLYLIWKLSNLKRFNRSPSHTLSWREILACSATYLARY
jgi:hypothetical protein